jgi:hypothetical protein
VKYGSYSLWRTEATLRRRRITNGSSSYSVRIAQRSAPSGSAQRSFMHAGFMESVQRRTSALSSA